MATTYAEKLRDPRWQQKRLNIMARDGWACRECNDRASNLQVDHRWYERGRDPWEYPDADLWTLCQACHHRIGYEREELAKAVAHLTWLQFKSLRTAIAATVAGNLDNSWRLVMAEPPKAIESRACIPELEALTQRCRKQREEILAQPFSSRLSAQLESIDEIETKVGDIYAAIAEASRSA